MSGMAAVVDGRSGPAAEAAAAAARMALLDLAEVGAARLLELHAAANGVDLGDIDQASLAQLSRLGAAWFRRPAGSTQTRGDRILAALGIVAVVRQAASTTARRPAAGGGGLTAAQRQQRKRAAEARWSVVTGGGQMPLGIPADAPGLAVARSAAPQQPPGPEIPARAATAPVVAVAPAAAARRPDADEIPDDKAIDYVRGWLWQFTGCGRGMPDDRTCRNVIAAAAGRSLCEIYDALNERFRRKVPPGTTWGWFVAVVRNHFAGIRVHQYGATAAMAG